MCVRVCVCVTLTASEAYTKSYKAMTVTEIPMAGPLTAATRGLGKLMKASTNLLRHTEVGVIRTRCGTLQSLMHRRNT